MALSRCRVTAFPPALGAMLIAVGLAGALANAQSFDCGKARYADEKTICRDPALGRLDQELASVYRRLLLALPREESEALDRREDEFLIAVSDCPPPLRPPPRLHRTELS